MCQLIGAGTISCGAPGSRPGSERNLLLSEEYSLCCEIRLVSGRPEPTTMWASVEQYLFSAKNYRDEGGPRIHEVQYDDGDSSQ